MKEAMFYEKLGDNQVQCLLCFRRCIIKEGQCGFCRARKNKKGKLYSLVYAQPLGLQIDPIELEPVYHLIPGHRNLCVYTASCNFRCKHCHNWHISQIGPEESVSKQYSPKAVVEEAFKKGCLSISHSINEPSIFYEYVYEIAKIAKQKGLKTVFHTNGTLSPQALRKLLKYIDAVTIDLKGFEEKFYQEISSAELAPVLQSLKIIREEGIHLEIVNLIIPTLNDDLRKIRKMCKWIRENLGEDVPLHFTRFFPAYKLTHLPSTPVETLEKAAEIAESVGLKYVYIGNLPGHKKNSTYCPGCKKRLIQRIHSTALSNKIKKGKCPFCRYEIKGIWN